MKPVRTDLAIVTASTDLLRAYDCLTSWSERARYTIPTYLVLNGPQVVASALLPRRNVVIQGTGEYLGVVPAFAKGVAAALADGREIIACFHDDLLIEEDDWDVKVAEAFESHPPMGLAGFGGARGLGSERLYQDPYDPMQLARHGFVSNMREAEKHGRRVGQAMQVVCLDGFSQIGRREFWTDAERGNLFDHLASWGVVHHFYDGMLGCFAKRLGWQVWMLPIACHHFGGQTAVADAGYAEWAKVQHPDGDQGFWRVAHEIGYREFKDVLPIRVGG